MLHPEIAPRGSQPAFEKQKANLLKLLKRVLSGYAQALAEDSYAGPVSGVTVSE
jgi:hypothetical protein